MQTHKPSEPKWTGALVVLAVLLVWEFASRTHAVNPTFFPPFSIVLTTLGRMVFMSETWESVGSTLLRCFSGYLFACAVGIPAGILMGRSQRLYFALEPLVEILRPIPSAAVIPIAILFLGIGDSMKVFVVVYACLWPVLINSLDGVRSIDPVLIETGKTFELTRSRFLFHIVIPAASPYFVTGMRVSLAIALILAITVEMIAGSNGIGFLILDSERSFKFTEMYAGVLLIGALGYLVNFLFVRITDRIMKWHKGFTATFL
jgi:ABC-type nitrate/sulfonate/bicarbonate transport system permease component